MAYGVKPRLSKGQWSSKMEEHQMGVEIAVLSTEVKHLTEAIKRLEDAIVSNQDKHDIRIAKLEDLRASNGGVGAMKTLAQNNVFIVSMAVLIGLVILASGAQGVAMVLSSASAKVSAK